MPTQNDNLRLWTIQSLQSIKQLKENGQLQVNWNRYPKADFFKPAYKWMSHQMKSKGVDCNGFAPIWAWQQKPTSKTARALLSDIEIENGVQVLEFLCPKDQVVFSKYSTWNDILDSFIDNKEQTIIDEKIIKNLFKIEPDKMNHDDSIQATIPILKREWIVEINDLVLD